MIPSFALFVQLEDGATSGGNVTITWTSDNSDQDVLTTIALFSTDPTFNGPFALVNDVPPDANKATFTLPNVIPGPGYQIALISMDDTSDILASSLEFSIGAEVTALTNFTSGALTSNSGATGISTASVPSSSMTTTTWRYPVKSAAPTPPQTGHATSVNVPAARLGLVGLAIGAWLS
ncbi:hypothetical protein C8R46DRAFT_1099438 [Mycena filopes]|nr:hypothetical protein C8R46DRAFT_1099438 [Mycena filopes]